MGAGLPTAEALADALDVREGVRRPEARVAQVRAAAEALRACAEAGWTVLLADALPAVRGAFGGPLFVRGDPAALTTVPRVALVGSRASPEASLAWTRECAWRLVTRGACVVSGLARGVDAAAHRAAVDAGGRTVAVLAHGLDRVYPPEHDALADAIVASGGALVSAYPPGTAPERWRFAARNRVQVALSRAVVAVYSEPEGGTMHTVAFAARSGVPVFVPRAPTIGDGLEAAARHGTATAVDDPDAAARAALRADLPPGALFQRR